MEYTIFVSLVAEMVTSPLEYSKDQIQDYEFKMKHSIKSPVTKCCPLFDFRMVLEQFFSFSNMVTLVNWEFSSKLNHLIQPDSGSLPVQ